MKKLFALILAFCLIIGMTACSGGNSGEAADTYEIKAAQEYTDAKDKGAVSALFYM